MKALGIVAVAAAGIGFFCYTEKGRQMVSDCWSGMQEGYSRMTDYVQQRGGVQEIVQSTIKREDPDTAMSHAFEAAVG